MTTMQHEKTDHKNVMGIFAPSTDFTTLFNDLRTRGYDKEDVSVIMSQATQDRYFAGGQNPEVTTKLEDKAPEGFTRGAVAGGILGAIIGGLTLTGSLFIPGAQVLLLGPAIGAISGLAAGAATGGLAGWLIGLGIPEVEAKFYHDAIDRDENVLVVVNARKEDQHVIEDAFKRFDAKKVNSL